MKTIKIVWRCKSCRKEWKEEMEVDENKMVELPSYRCPLCFDKLDCRIEGQLKKNLY
jgi:predicted SprT family Zn-dependent metalloprotease